MHDLFDQEQFRKARECRLPSVQCLLVSDSIGERVQTDTYLVQAASEGFSPEEVIVKTKGIDLLSLEAGGI